jgi:hypothetical protein
MSQISKRVLLASAFAFLVVALLACPSKPTPAGGSAPVTVSKPVPATLLTHIGQPVANFVGLRCNNFSGPACTDFRRQHLDGSEDAFPFMIPPGMVFVITDVSWAASAVAGTDLRFFIQSGAPSIRYAQTAVADSSGFVAVADHFTTGFAFSTMPSFVITSFSAETPEFIGVQGYFVSQ